MLSVLRLLNRSIVGGKRNGQLKNCMCPLLVVMQLTVEMFKSCLCQNEDNLHFPVENIFLKCLLNLYFTRYLAGIGNLKISLKNTVSAS